MIVSVVVHFGNEIDVFVVILWNDERRYCYTYSLVPVTSDKIEENQ